MLSRHAMPVLAAVLGAALLSSCTPSGAGIPDAQAATATWLTELELPAGSLPEEARTLDGAILPGAGDAPGVMVTARVEPGKEAHLTLAYVPDTGDVEPAELGVDVAGEILDVEAAASPDLTAIAGTAYVAGLRRPYVLTSLDRRTWTLVPTTTATDGHSTLAVAVAGTTSYVTTQDATGNGHVMSIVGGTTTSTQLPAEPATDVWPGSVAAAGSDVVVIGLERAEGDDTWSSAVWTSHDDGATFTHAPFTEPEARVSGLVRAGDTWVATGTVPDGDDRRPASWTSTDGTAWKADRRWRPGDVTRGDDRTLGRPTVGSDGRVRVWLSDADFGGDVYERDAKGRWRVASPRTPISDAPGLDADASVSVGADGTTHVLRVVGSWAQLQRKTADGWTPVARLSAHDPVRTASGARLRGDTVEVELEHAVHRNGEIYRTRQPANHRLAVTDVVAPASMPPAFAWASSATDPATGTEVTVGGIPLLPAEIPDDATSPSAWLRTVLETADGEVSRPPLDLTSARDVRSVTHVPGHGFIVSLTEATNFDDPGQASFAHSPDGATWTTTSAKTLGETSEEGSGAAAMCTLADGRVLALGHSGDEPATWVLDGSTWTRGNADGVPADQELDACTSTPDGVTATTTDDDDITRLWTTVDGATFSPAGELPDDGLVRSISRSGDLYVAAGRITTPTYDGNVVWLSQDSISWRHVKIPVRGTIVTQADAAGAVVAVGHVGGPRIFRVDVAAAWDAAHP